MLQGDKTRIIGGTDASENEFPWICSVLKEDLTVKQTIMTRREKEYQLNYHFSSTAVRRLYLHASLLSSLFRQRTALKGKEQDTNKT